MKKILKIAIASVLLFQVSCRSDDDSLESYGEFDNGFILSNEGNFGSPNASVDFMSIDFQEVQNGIYSSTNSESVGDVLQSISFSDDKAYLVVNNSNKVIVANRYTMVKETVITEEINNPRYATVTNDKLYVTNSAYQGANYVSVYDANATFLSKIELTSTAERILSVGNKVFVQNASFGYGNKFTLIDPATDTVETTISIPDVQIQKSVAYEDAAYVLANGSMDSYIYKIGTDGQIDTTYTIEGIDNAKNLDVEQGKFYYTSDNKIYKMAMNSTSSPSAPFITVDDNSWSTLYGFDVIGNLVFTSDAKGFTESSVIKVYSATDADLLKTFTAGMGTNGFYYNN